MSLNKGLPDDGRETGSYKSRYEDNTKRRICLEAAYILIVMFSSFALLYFTFSQVLLTKFAIPNEKVNVFQKYAYCLSSGLLGGATFGMKYFYRVVARGLWNEDRIYWRIFSPIISVSVSFVLGTILYNDIIQSTPQAIVVGFLAGYFADEAVSKMYDVACVLFSKPDSSRDQVLEEEIKVSKKAE